MKMSVSFSLLLLSLIQIVSASDITQILNKYPEFSKFNNYLTITNLAGEINRRQTITVLVVDNANLSPLSYRTRDVIRKILSVHVILDYFDVRKLQSLPTTSPAPLLATLFQSTGEAKGQQGLLNVTHPTPDAVVLGSAMPGSVTSSSLVVSVAADPYKLSVLQINKPIIPHGVDGLKTFSPPSTAAAAPSAIPVPPPSTAPVTDKPAETTPAAEKAKGKSAAAALEIGVAVVCTMAVPILFTRH